MRLFGPNFLFKFLPAHCGKNEVCVDNVWSNKQQQSAPGTCFICSIRDERAKSEIRHHTAPKQHQFLANTGTRDLTYKLGWLTEGFGPDHSNAVGSFKDFTLVEFSDHWHSKFEYLVEQSHKWVFKLITPIYQLIKTFFCKNLYRILVVFIWFCRKSMKTLPAVNSKLCLPWYFFVCWL